MIYLNARRLTRLLNVLFCVEQYYQRRVGRRVGSDVCDKQILRTCVVRATCSMFAHVVMHTTQINNTPFNANTYLFRWR